MRIAGMTVLSFALVGLLGCAATKNVRYTPARWVEDQDREPVDPPPTHEEYTVSDAVNHQFFYQLERLTNLSLRGEHVLHGLGFSTLQEALNTNNFDEVADSSWFTNRLGRRPMNVAELKRGPNRGTGPDMSGPWTILSSKVEGVTAGFVFEDSRGDKYLVKFDPSGYPELATSSDIIGSKILYAMGFNVPETYLVKFQAANVRVSPKATTKDRYGKKIPFKEEDLDQLFRRISKTSHDQYRAVASKLIEGKILGPTPLRGKRRGDPNDHIPHEHRRELRGYRVVSALINNSDTKESNTLDSFVTVGTEKKGHVQHYVLDFGSSLGSAGSHGKGKAHLDEYQFNPHRVTASLLTAGIYQPDWEKKEDSGLTSVGVLDSKDFRPEKWRPSYPNPGFQNMTDRDAFWATKILTRLTEADLRAIVEEAQYSDPQATAYVTKVLTERLQKIGRYWYGTVNPLDEFEWKQDGDKGYLSFDDLMIRSGLVSSGSASYRYRLIQDHGAYEIVPWTETRETRAAFERSAYEKMKPGKSYLAQIQTKRDGEEFWGPTVDVVLERSSEVKLLGLNRRYRQ